MSGSEQDNSKPLQRTPLYAEHLALGAKLVPFAGFEMPVQYSGVIDEHRTTRQAAGLFDVSHMGEFDLRGPRAAALLDHLTPSKVSALPIGKVLYSVLTTPTGTIVDDLLIYRLAEAHFMVVVNASNRDKDLAWISSEAGRFGVEVQDHSDQTALIAIQGPAAREIVARLVEDVDALAAKYYTWIRGRIAGRPMLASRTGYTGELGFEIFIANGDAPLVWRALLEEGQSAGLKPCGLAARDTLRLEAGLPLYGNDIDDSTNLIEAELGFCFDRAKAEFIGKAALDRIERDGVTRRRVGFELKGAGVPRPGSTAWLGSERVGTVSSGTFSPTLERGLGMAYLDLAQSSDGTRLEIDIRGRRVPAEVVPLPFYRRSTGKKLS